MGCGFSGSNGGKIKINVIEATSIAIEQSIQENEEPNPRRQSLLQTPPRNKSSKTNS